jgi:translation initiation factor IF-2
VSLYRIENLSQVNKIGDIQNRKLFPGQSGTISGFKEMPDAGHPLYKVSDPFEAKLISNIRQKRHDAEASNKKSIHQLDKKLIKVDRREKRRLYSGDQFGVLSQLDLLDESDISSMKKQLGKINAN